MNTLTIGRLVRALAFGLVLLSLFLGLGLTGSHRVEAKGNDAKNSVSQEKGACDGLGGSFSVDKKNSTTCTYSDGSFTYCVNKGKHSRCVDFMGPEMDLVAGHPGTFSPLGDIQFDEPARIADPVATQPVQSGGADDSLHMEPTATATVVIEEPTVIATDSGNAGDETDPEPTATADAVSVDQVQIDVPAKPARP
jgi:hypothetical protein